MPDIKAGRRITVKNGPGYGRRNDRSNGRPSKKLLTLGLLLVSALSVIIFGGTAYLTASGMDPVEFYSNLADPYMKFVSIPAGLRREQIATIFKKTLSWNDQQVQGFLTTAPSDSRGYLDGYYLPGTYWVRVGATGPEVARQMLEAFNSKVSNQILGQNLKGNLDKAQPTTSGLKSKLNIDTAVRIASIIQREAAGKKDMNLISGVIWNRLFDGMTLDMDATLQYINGTSTNWWPQPKSSDKNIDSPYNTYENKGLPPMAISNPSIDAIKAALNPTKTTCLFYLHDNNGNIHCSATYAMHVQNIQKYLLGRK